MSALRVLESEEISLLLSSFLSQHACWCMRRTAQTVLSPTTAPRVRRALSWRQELSQLYATLDAFLSLKALALVPLQEIRLFFDATSSAGLFDARLGQLLALAGELLVIRELKCGEPAIQQQRDDGELRVQTLPELNARHECFEATLASITEQLACNRVPSQDLPAPSTTARPRRRLSRQSSMVCLDERPGSGAVKAYSSAVEWKLECEKWLGIVRGAESARVALEQLFETEGVVTLERVAQVLTSNRCAVRPSRQLPLESVPAVLLMLISRTLGGLSIQTVKRSMRGPQVVLPLKSSRSLTSDTVSGFQHFEGTSSATAKHLLQEELHALNEKYDDIKLVIERAFIAMLPSISPGFSISESPHESRRHEVSTDAD